MIKRYFECELDEGKIIVVVEADASISCDGMMQMLIVPYSVIYDAFGPLQTSGGGILSAIEITEQQALDRTDKIYDAEMDPML